MQATKKSQTGSFVIEALISILLFAVGIVALVMIVAQGTNQVGQSKYRNEASYLAGELIGDMWVSPSSLSAFAASNDWNSRVAALPGGQATYPVSGTQVAIDISWNDNKVSGVGATHHYTTTAVIAKN